MSRKGILKDLSYCLLNMFNSRNNDLDGYWGIGLLYKHAKNANSRKVTLDLLEGSIQPVSDFYSRIALLYRTQLKAQLRKRGFKFGSLSKAEIHLSFNDSTYARPFRSRCGDPYVCDVVIESVSGCRKTSRLTGYCWPHDPKREMKRYSTELSSLGLAGDGDDIDILEDIEATFNVRFTDEEVGQCHTVGDIYELLLTKLDFPIKEQAAGICASHRAFNQVRTAIHTVSSALVKPTTQMKDLGLTNHRGVLEHLRKVGLRVPHFRWTIKGRLVFISVALIVGVLFYFEWYTVLAVLLVTHVWRLIKTLPIEYVGSVEKLVEEIVTLNHGYYMEYGARADSGTIWKSLAAICRQHRGETVERITPSTFVLK